MKYLKILLPLLMVLLLTNCAANPSLSELTIVESIGIDYEKSDTSVSLQYLNLAKGSGTTDALTGGITSVASGSGYGISNALSSTSTALSQQIFFGQNKAIVFGSNYTKNGIDNSFDYLLRSVDSRPDVLVAVSSDSAKKVIESKENDARIPAESLYELITNGEKHAYSVVTCVDDVLNLYSDKTSDIYMPQIMPEKNACKCDGIAIFSGNKYASTLKGTDCLGFLILKNKVSNGYFNIYDSELGNVRLEIISSKAKNSIKYSNKKYLFTSEIKLDLMLDEVEKGTTVAIDKNKIKAIENLANKRISSICRSTISSCIDSKSDPLMLGKYLAKYDSKQYEMVKDDWKNELDKIQCKINVSTNLEKVNDTAVRG